MPRSMQHCHCAATHTDLFAVDQREDRSLPTGQAHIRVQSSDFSASHGGQKFGGPEVITVPMSHQNLGHRAPGRRFHDVSHMISVSHWTRINDDDVLGVWFADEVGIRALQRHRGGVVTGEYMD